MLLRKIGDFIRVADMKKTPDVRATKEFVDLDALVTKFRYVRALSIILHGKTETKLLTLITSYLPVCL